MAETKENSTKQTSITQNQHQTAAQYDEILKLLELMVNNSSALALGYKTLSQYEKCPKFLVHLLKIGFSSSSSIKLRKLSCASFLIFLKNNYSKEAQITDEDRLSIVSFLLENLTTEDYYLKNCLSKSLGIISAKEYPTGYEGFMKILISKLQHNPSEELIDTILRILIGVFKECDDSCAGITGELLPVILNVFKLSKQNQKNREKCLILISLLFNKLSYADGNDYDLLSRCLDTNSLMDNSISLFTSILISNPKLLLDIKKWTIRILDILIRDMPIYSSKFFNILIEPAWKLLVLELSLYGEVVIFNKTIEFTEDEVITVEEENYDYTRGYESDDDEETYGMDGLIKELIDFCVDLLKRNSVIEAIRPALYSFLLCIKGYLLMPHNSIVLWKNDPNLYISEEYDEENINSVRSKTLGLIREISREIEDDDLVQFINLIISELTEGIKIDNYKDVIRLDDYNLIAPYLEKLNTDKLYLQTRQESNMLILGTLDDDLLRLKERQVIPIDHLMKLINYLIDIISFPSKEGSILIGRTIWCISKLLCLFRNDYDTLLRIFESISKCMCHSNSDVCVRLVGAQALSIISQRMISGKKTIDNECIISDYDCLISLLDKVNEDTIFIPIDNLLYLSKLNLEKALYLPVKHLNPLLKIYAKNFNDTVLGNKMLELIKIWCRDKTSAKVLLEKFIPIAIKVFEEFYKDIGKTNDNFEMVKKTVMTEHSNPDINTSLDMLPNLIDIITMLTKYSSESGDDQNLKWISLIVKALCDILIRTSDVTILQRGCSFLRFYIALCKNTIIQENQVQMIIDIINRFFDPSLLESALLFLGNVISQFFFHIESKIIPSLLENIVKRIYKAKMPSIVQSLILVYSRFLTKFPVDTLNFLISIQVENRVGLKVLIDKWLLHQPLFRGKYFKNISIQALSTLYQMKNNIVESLMVIGYNPSHSTASVEVNAPCKILSVLIRCLNNEFMQEKIKKDKTNYANLHNNNDEDDDDDYDNDRLDKVEDDYKNEEDDKENNSFKLEGNDDDEEDNNSNKKLDINEDEFKNIQDEPRDFSSKLQFLNTQGKSGGLNNLEQGSEIYLTEMLGFDYNDIEGDEDETTEEDLVYLTDLNTDFVLKEYLTDWFQKFKTQDEEYLMECLKLLPKDDQKLFKSFNLN